MELEIPRKSFSLILGKAPHFNAIGFPYVAAVLFLLFLPSRECLDFDQYVITDYISAVLLAKNAV